MRRNTFVLLTWVIISPLSAAAQSNAGWTVGDHLSAEKTTSWQSEIHLLARDDMTPDQVLGQRNLSVIEKHQAQAWGLSLKEERRFVFLMANRTGRYYKNRSLTPIEILGINARTPLERAHYAQVAAHQAFEKEAKLLAFNRAYSIAAIQLKNRLKLPLLRAFDVDKFSPLNFKPVVLKKNDTLLLFLGLEDSVKPILISLLKSIHGEPTIKLHLYFVGKDVTRKKISTWARSHTITPKRVNEGGITFNFGNKRFSALHGQFKTPRLILVRDGKSSLVDVGRF